MIAKIISGSNIGGLLHYLTKKPHEVLAVNKLFPSDDVKYISDEFKQIQGLNKRCKKNVMHIVLSFPENENLDAEKMKTITENFMKAFEADDNQWISFQHFDTKHKHQHTIINRVKMG